MKRTFLQLCSLDVIMAALPQGASVSKGVI
jgi:hypothetical protein